MADHHFTFDDEELGELIAVLKMAEKEIADLYATTKRVMGPEDTEPMKSRSDRLFRLRQKLSTLPGTCGAVMVWDNVVLTSHPPCYRHWCEKCGNTATLSRVHDDLFCSALVAEKAE